MIGETLANCTTAFRKPGSSTADTDMGEADGEDRNMDSDIDIDMEN